MVYHWLKNKQPLPLRSFCELCALPCEDSLSLCPGCLGDLPRVVHACERCAVSLSPAECGGLCGHCQANPPSFERTQCLFAYQYPVDHLIRRFKFGERLHLARSLGELLGRAMCRFYAAEQPSPQGLIAVPLHVSRMRERGFNQAWELARFCARTAAIPALKSACRRTRNTAHQPGLSRSARRQNLSGAFEITATDLPPRVAVIDDVLTTGTTCEALSRALLNAGVKEVHLWCIARAL